MAQIRKTVIIEKSEFKQYPNKPLMRKHKYEFKPGVYWECNLRDNFKWRRVGIGDTPEEAYRDWQERNQK